MSFVPSRSVADFLQLWLKEYVDDCERVYKRKSKFYRHCVSRFKRGEYRVILILDRLYDVDKLPQWGDKLATDLHTLCLREHMILLRVHALKPIKELGLSHDGLLLDFATNYP